MNLPWLEPAWQGIRMRRQADRLPHALLITGMEGIGKRILVEQLTRALLCQQPDPAGHACGTCKSCQMFSAGSHPDYRLLTLEANEKTGKPYRDIRIEQIRALVGYLGLKSQYGGYRVTVIDPAERMNINAANSLLKTLEEPGEDNVLILVSAVPGRLPATVRSRCQQIALHIPARRQALDWLQAQGADQPELCLSLAAGAPLRALALAGEGGALERRQICLDDLGRLALGQADPLQVAADWFRQEDFTNLRWLSVCLMDLARLSMAGPRAEVRNIDRQRDLQALAEGVDCAHLYRFLDRVLEALRLEHANLNRQLLLEDLLLEWCALFRCPASR